MSTLLSPKTITILLPRILFKVCLMRRRDLSGIFSPKKVITQFLVLLVILISQEKISLAKEPESLAPGKSHQAGLKEKTIDTQRSTKKLNMFINNHEGVMAMATGKVGHVGIVSHSIAKQYVSILTQKLSQTQIDLDKLRNHGAIRFGNEGYAVYRGTLMELKQIERAMLVASVMNAGSEMYKKTKLSKKIKRLEKKLARYCVVEYSKASSGKKAELYMPGELDEKKRKEQKEYRVAFSSLFTPDEESLSMDLKVNLTTLVYKTNAVSSYSFVKEEASVSFSSQALNSYTGVNMGMSMVKKKRCAIIYLFKTRVTF